MQFDDNNKPLECPVCHSKFSVKEQVRKCMYDHTPTEIDEAGVMISDWM